jgi:hypothetical protein
MNRRLFAVLVLAGLVLPAISVAHDPSLHKGRATTGEILSVSDDRFQIKTEKGSVTVLLSGNPKVEKGDRQGSIGDLKKGIRATVFGTTLGSGELVAREIVLPGSDSNRNGHKH